MATNPGYELQAMRKARQVACLECGEVFTAKDPRAKYCSNRCSQKAKYKRMKERSAGNN